MVWMLAGSYHLHEYNLVMGLHTYASAKPSHGCYQEISGVNYNYSLQLPQVLNPIPHQQRLAIPYVGSYFAGTYPIADFIFGSYYLCDCIYQGWVG